MTVVAAADGAERLVLAGDAPDSDVVELPTVGIDVGSATFHLAVSRVRLERRAQQLSSRYEVVAREVLLESPVMLTPYLDEETIDVDAVEEGVRRAYEEAGARPQDIESGVVLLTGRALARRNARVLAERLAGDSGRFVCAAAGHHFEAVLAAHGSGAVERSTSGVPVVAMDVGGATTKLALAVDGRVRSTAALVAGGRLLAWDESRRLVRAEAPAVQLGAAIGVPLRLGAVVEPSLIETVCEHMAAAVLAQLGGAAGQAGPVGQPLLLTPPFPPPPAGFEIVASGGVAEYFGTAPSADLGDLGPHLARALLGGLRGAGLDGRLRPGLERIRATVIGAAQFTTQVSGSTIRVGSEDVLPLHDVPVARPDMAIGPLVDRRAVAAAVRHALGRRLGGIAGRRAAALAISWEGPPEYRRLRALAEGIRDGADGTMDGHLLVVAVDRDIAASLGRILVEELGVDGRAVVCLDNLELGEFDHIDLGRPSRPANVVPVVVKSLLFDASPAPSDVTASTHLDQGGTS